MHVEILDEDGAPCAFETVGNIVITTKTNSFMPLIRYNSYDQGRLILDSDGKEYLEIVVARKHNVVRVDDISIDSSVFFYIIQKLNMSGAEIQQFQFIKKEKTLNVVVSSAKETDPTDISQAIASILEQEFALHFDSVNVLVGEEHFLENTKKKKQYYFSFDRTPS